jgi:hypothetical protein
MSDLPEQRTNAAINPAERQKLIDDIQRAVVSGHLPEDVLRAIDVSARGVYVGGDFSGYLVTGDRNIIMVAPPVQMADENELLRAALQKYQAELTGLMLPGEAADRLAEPYPGLFPFRLQDADQFFGRDQAVVDLLALLEQHRLIWLHGRSGTGKTSIIRAGLMPVMLRRGILPIYVRLAGDTPTLALKKELLKEYFSKKLEVAHDSLQQFLVKVRGFYPDQQIVICLDQFEELFTRLTAEEVDTFGEELQDSLLNRNLDLKFLLAIRGDYFSETYSIRQRLLDIRSAEFAIHPLSVAEARQAICRPAEIYGLTLEDDLVTKVLADLGQDEIIPSQLQLVCQKMMQWASGNQKSVRLSAYEAQGGAEQILRQYLAQTLQDDRQVPIEEQPAGRYLLSTLVTPEGERQAKHRNDWYADPRIQPWALAWYAKREQLNLLDTDVDLQSLRQHAMEDYLKQVEGYVSGSSETLKTLLESYSESITIAYLRSMNVAFVDQVISTLRQVRLVDVVGKENGEPIIELVHDYLRGEILSWMDEGELDARRVRRILDQKHYDYETYQFLFDSKELEIVAAQLSNPALILTDDDRRLLLYSAIAHGRGQRWIALAGENSTPWLRQACQDEHCPAAVRRGAAANLGAASDRETFEQLEQAVLESKGESNKFAAEMLAAYLHRLPTEPALTARLKRRVLIPLARLRVRDGMEERRRMRRVAMLAALAGEIIQFFVLAVNGDFRGDRVVDSLASFLVFLLLSQIFAYFFAELITSLELITQRSPIAGRILILGGAGIVAGFPLFLTIVGTAIAWFAGGLIGFVLGLSNPQGHRRSPILRWSLSGFAGSVTFVWTLFNAPMIDFFYFMAAIIAAGFVAVYLFFGTSGYARS